MTGAGPTGDDGQRDDDRRGDAFHGPAGVQRGSGNLQVNFHEHRTGILSACAVVLVCVATVIAVRVGGDRGTRGDGPPAGPQITNRATAPAPGTAGADPSVLTGRLVNDGSGLCLRAPGTGDGLVPVQDTCTGAADRTWTLTQDGGAARTLRNAHSGRCLAVTGLENLAPARQLACTAQDDGQRWEPQWGTGDRAGHFALRNARNAKCLVAQGREVARPAAQTSCGEEYDDQWWHLAP
ncbi:RICIN domain-containing protein [Streptomyces sp. NPDC059564]|uniref:RICIN domain-containing protein n=1 Tax=Streptomyces sp. NPDC059564 TaxID=3346865 RepID=UPI00368E8FB2